MNTAELKDAIKKMFHWNRERTECKVEEGAYKAIMWKWVRECGMPLQDAFDTFDEIEAEAHDELELELFEECMGIS